MEASARTPRFVIIVPPTDHYRMFEIIGDVKTFKSEPLNFGPSRNSTPCCANCPATQYQQLPRTSGVVQHFPPLAPEKLISKVVEPDRKTPLDPDVVLDAEEAPVRNRDVFKTTRQIERNCTSTAKPPTEELTNKLEFNHLLGQTTKTHPQEPEQMHEALQFFDGYILLQKLDIPINYEKIRIAPKDKRLKDDHSARIVVDTDCGNRHVTLLKGYEDPYGTIYSPSLDKVAPSEDRLVASTSSCQQDWYKWGRSSAINQGCCNNEATDEIWPEKTQNAERAWPREVVRLETIPPLTVCAAAELELDPESFSVTESFDPLLDLVNFEDKRSVSETLVKTKSKHSRLASMTKDNSGQAAVDYFGVKRNSQHSNYGSSPQYCITYHDDEHMRRLQRGPSAQWYLSNNPLIWRPTAPILTGPLHMPAATSKLVARRKKTKLHQKQMPTTKQRNVRKKLKAKTVASSPHRLMKLNKTKATAASAVSRCKAKSSKVPMLSKCRNSPASCNLYSAASTGSERGRNDRRLETENHPDEPIGIEFSTSFESRVDLGSHNEIESASSSYSSDKCRIEIATQNSMLFNSSHAEARSKDHQFSIEEPNNDCEYRYCSEDKILAESHCSRFVDHQQFEDSTLRQSSKFNLADDDDSATKRSSRRNSKRPAHLTDFYIDTHLKRKTLGSEVVSK